MSDQVKKEKSGLFSMSNVSKVVDFSTFRKAPEQFIKGQSVKSGDKVKTVSGDKDYKKLIKPELMMEALKEAGVTEEMTNKVVELIEAKQKPVGVKARLDEMKKKKEDEKEEKVEEKKEEKEEKEEKVDEKKEEKDEKDEKKEEKEEK